MERKKRKDASIPVSAMSDIAFLLLIFFIVSSIAEAEKEIPIELPESVVAIQETEKFFNVYIEADGTITFGNKASTLDDLSRYASFRLIKTPEIKALIRASKDVRYEYINGVFQALKEGGINNILLVTKKKKKDQI